MAQKRPAWPWALAVLVALALGLVVGRMLNRPSDALEPPPLLFDISDPTHTMATGSLALSPNGEHLVFARMDTLGRQSLWIRRLDEDDARPLQGTLEGRHPFWSADGKNIGFFVGNAVHRSSVEGSAASLIGSVPGTPMGGSWNSRDVILVGNDDGPIHRLSASGGTVDAVTELVGEFEDTHCWPTFLPDGEHFIFLSDASTDEGHRLYVHSLDGKEKKVVKKGLRSSIFVDLGGALLLSQNGQLFAQPFDFSRREFSGPQLLVQDKLHPFGERHECALTLSNNGVLAFQSPSDESIIVQVPLDGSPRKKLLPTDRYRNPRLSPDGRKIAFEIQGSSDERLIWVQDLARGARTLVSDRGSMSDSPAWSHDSEILYFGSSASGRWEAYRKRVYEGLPPELLGSPEGSDDVSILDVSSDGKRLLGGVNMKGTGSDLYLASLDGEELGWTAWVSTAAREQFARFSPDARWIAFESDTSGRREIYVAPVDGGPAVKQWLISVNGGSDPAWSRDGSKLYYRTLTGSLMEAAVSVGDGIFEFEAPVLHFPLNPPRVGFLRNAYDPHPDGKSVIAFVETGEYKPSIRVRTGWRQW